MKTLVRILFAFVLTVLIGQPQRVYAQNWVQLTKLCDSGIVSIYFLDKQGYPGIGFAGSQDGRVFLTANYGISWTEARTILPIHGPITSFVFKDAFNGWLSCRQANRSGCYETHDGGNTWSQLGVNTWGDRFAIDYNPYNGRLFLSSPVDKFRSSSDNGLNWSVIGPDYVNGITFSTQLVGVASCFSGGMRFTRDAGVSWLPSAMATECWNPLASGPTVFFVASEATWQVYCSTDAGNVWNVRGQLPKRPTGDIRGICGQLYVQTESGLYYSADEGFNWHSLGGPGNQADSRFYTVGTACYAGDRSGAVYKLHDIDHPPEGRLLLTGPVPTILTTKCDGLDTDMIVFGATTCQTTKLLGFSYDSLKSSPGLAIYQPAGTFRFIRPGGDTVHLRPAFPFTFTLEDTSFVPLHVRYRPSGASDSAVVTFHFQIGQFFFDTTLVLHAMRDRRVSVAFAGTPLELSSKSGCVTATGTFTINNGKCDSVTVLDVRPVDNVHFHLGTTLPALLLPYGSLPITITASGETKDTFTTTIDVLVEVGGVQSDLQVEATLVVQRDGRIAPELLRSVHVAPTNICARRRHVIPIRNGGCYRMVCDTVRWFIPVPELSIIQEPVFPDTVQVGQQDSIVLEFTPSTVLSRAGILEWKFSSGALHVDTLMQVHTESFDLAKAVLSADAMEFDSILRCNESERSVFILNESCKPTQLVEIKPSRDLSFISVTPALGNWIAPGDSVEVRVHLKPRAPGDARSSIQYFYDDSSGSQQSLTVNLHAYVIPDVPRTTLSATSIAMNLLAPCSAHDTSIMITNISLCDTITITTADLKGSPWFTNDTSGLPISIAPGKSAALYVHIQTTSDSAGVAMLHIGGFGIDSVISLSATTTPIAGDEVIASYNNAAFHAKLCSTDTKQFMLHNRTCEPIEISDLHLSDSSVFGIVSPHANRFTIAAGDSIPVQLLFNAEDTNGANVSLHYETSDGKIARDISLAGLTTTRPKAVQFALRAMDGSNAASRLPGDTLSLALVALGDAPDSLGLTSVLTTLNYDHNLLSLLNASGNDGWSNPPSSTDDIRVASVNAHMLTSGTPLVTLHFTTTFAEPRSTPVLLTKTSLNDGDQSFARCVMSASAGETAVVSIAPFCNDSLFGDALLGLPIVLGSVEAKAAGMGATLHITLAANVPATCHFKLVDMRGAVVEDFGKYTARVGSQEVILPVRMSSGMFELVLESGGRRLGRRISLVK